MENVGRTTHGRLYQPLCGGFKKTQNRSQSHHFPPTSTIIYYYEYTPWVAVHTQQTGINVKKVMDTWILQMGLPVVTITRMDQEKARADQTLFLIAPGAKPNQSSPFE